SRRRTPGARAFDRRGASPERPRARHPGLRGGRARAFERHAQENSNGCAGDQGSPVVEQGMRAPEGEATRAFTATDKTKGADRRSGPFSFAPSPTFVIARSARDEGIQLPATMDCFAEP